MQVYYVAKKCSQRCSAEEYAIELAKHFVTEYPLVMPAALKQALHMLHSQAASLCILCRQVSRAKVWVEEAPWKRVQVQDQPHNHGEHCDAWSCEGIRYMHLTWLMP